MAVSVRTTRILGAVGVSAALIGGALIVTNPNFSLSFLHSGIANAATTEELLKEYAQKDSDNDGLPDWEEALYGTDPHNAHSISPTLTDGQAVAEGLIKPQMSIASSSPQNILDSIPGQLPADGSLTQQFSQDFMQSYLNAVSQNASASSDGSASLSQGDEQNLVSQLISDYTQKAESIVVSPYTAVDVHTESSVSLSQYAGEVEQIFVKNTPADTSSPVDLMQAYVVNGDASAQPKIAADATSFDAMAKALAQLSVPPSVATDHLELMQSIDTLGRAMQAVANYQKDPATVLGAVGVYKPATDSMKSAFQDLAQQLIAGGEPTGDQPGAILIQIARTIQSQ